MARRKNCLGGYIAWLGVFSSGEAWDPSRKSQAVLKRANEANINTMGRIKKSNIVVQYRAT
jgi:hypothetical protein